jgi:DNA-binding response OmpR family regulator
MRVLIVEDEVRLARNIARVLRSPAGFAVDVSTDGVDGRHMAMTNPYDLIVLDLMLPGLSGMKILRDLRAGGNSVPVLILTARDSSEDIVEGLETGSDDYLTKPFEMAELVARCKALVRRAYNRSDPVIRVGQLAVDTTARSVTMNGRAVELPAMEYRLLEYLAMRAGQIVSKEEILEHLYDFDAERFSNVIEVYVSALRRKLGSGKEGDMIRTYRNQGYRLEEDRT